MGKVLELKGCVLNTVNSVNAFIRRSVGFYLCEPVRNNIGINGVVPNDLA